ncbi:MAG: hypothetical protein HUK20_00245 [Fibrobacter sp.]|nr:hypothetical protein [Fibrobacter sp.]
MKEVERCTNGKTMVVIYILPNGKHVPIASGNITVEVREAVDRFTNSRLPSVYIRGFFERILGCYGNSNKQTNKGHEQ